MFKYQVQTFRGGDSPEAPHFFVLSKGLNSGKPLDEPCPNCYIVRCEKEESRELFYWLCYALWKANYFKPHQMGSVIPFLRINSLRAALQIVGSHYP